MATTDDERLMAGVMVGGIYVLAVMLLITTELRRIREELQRKPEPTVIDVDSPQREEAE